VTLPLAPLRSSTVRHGEERVGELFRVCRVFMARSRDRSARETSFLQSCKCSRNVTPRDDDQLL